MFFSKYIQIIIGINFFNKKKKKKKEEKSLDLNRLGEHLLKSIC